MRYTFVWVVAKLPCLSTPSGDTVPLSVVSGVPYLEYNGLHEASKNIVLQHVGLSAKDRHVFMHIVINNTAAAVV